MQFIDRSNSFSGFEFGTPARATGISAGCHTAGFGSSSRAD